MKPILPGPVIETDIPARLDRLPWCRFHTLVIAALGITWILDGLEVTLAGAVASALQQSPVLRLTELQIGTAASAYLAGAVIGAFVFGWLTDLLGRKKMFWVTLALYLLATAACAFAPKFYWFAFFRFLTGAGIGGEYTAINSAIQELIPARYRGRIDLLVNGSFWIGAAFGALGSVVLLAPGVLPPDWGWRACFLIGAMLGVIILLLRRWIPESPRWLMMHGRLIEAEAIMRAIESRAHSAPAAELPTVRLHVRRDVIGPVSLMQALFRLYPRRAVLGVVLMSSQAFFYNAIFFTYALVLSHFFGIAADRVGLFLLPFALGNFLGPLLLGPLFDTIGRRPMIASTYATSGLLLLITALLFNYGVLDVVGQTLAWSVVFFFASAAASSAYLVVAESFPLEVRALAIALFYALGTGLGGVAGPLVFGALIGTGERSAISGGYVFGAVLMLVAAIVELWLGYAAERKPLEQVARPLSAADPK